MCFNGKIGVFVAKQNKDSTIPPTKNLANTVKKTENSVESSLNIIADDPKRAPMEMRSI